MFNDAFRRLGDASIDLFPASIAARQDRLSASVYEEINNGVYQAGFATSQRAYEKAVRTLFAAWINLSKDSRRAVTCSDRVSSKPIGGFFARWFASTPFTTVISNAISACSNQKNCKSATSF
jgi:hypothetical protein